MPIREKFRTIAALLTRCRELEDDGRVLLWCEERNPDPSKEGYVWVGFCSFYDTEQQRLRQCGEQLMYLEMEGCHEPGYAPERMEGYQDAEDRVW